MRYCSITGYVMLVTLARSGHERILRYVSWIKCTLDVPLLAADASDAA